MKRSRALFWGAIALGLLLVSPCLSTGFVADDHFHRLMLRRDPGVSGLSYQPFDLFRFATGEPRVTRELMDEGVFAWWTDPRAVLAFFRPASSLTHWLDARLWPSSPLWMHLHSLAWFALLLGVVGALYRRFSEGPRGAELALLLFAIDDAHAPAVGWIANRNQIVAPGFAFAALLVYDRFRRDGFRAGAWLGPLLLLLGLLAGEAALVACAYFVAYAVVLDPGKPRERFGGLAPYLGVLIIWRVVYSVLGYGALGSGLYVDPARDPFVFAAAVLERWPVLALAQIALPWADFWEVYPLASPSLSYVVGALAWLVLLGFVLLVKPLWRESRVVRFWALGAILALIPVCASFPHDRLLLGAGVGAMAVVAALLQRAFRARGTLRSSITLGALGAVHLVLAPVLLPIRAARVDDFNRVFHAADRTIPSGPEIADKCLILVNPPLDPFAAYFPIYRQAEGRPRPQHLLWLNTGVTELSITGIDAYSLRVRAKAGFLSSTTQLMLRDLTRPLRAGEVIHLSAATIQITESTDDGRPLEIVVRFREPLMSARLLFLEWRGRGYVPFRLPAEGDSVVVPALDVASALFG